MPNVEPIEAIRATAGPTRRRRDTVYRSLLDRIQSGQYARHTRLPTERELAVEFDVSRPVIRGALARLRDSGLVRSVQGSGSIVLHDAGSRPDMVQGQTSVRDLQRCFEFRLVIEGEAAFFAARRGGAAALEAIRSSVEAVERSRQTGAYKAGESFDFHKAVAEASDNVFYVQALDSVARFAGFRIYMGRSAALSNPSERLALINGEHEMILQHIERREADEARDAMRRHIERARDLFMECLPLGRGAFEDVAWVGSGKDSPGQLHVAHGEHEYDR